MLSKNKISLKNLTSIISDSFILDFGNGLKIWTSFKTLVSKNATTAWLKRTLV